MTKIGFISAEQSIDKVEEIIPVLQNLCTLQIFTYKSLEEVKDIYLTHCLFLDGVIFGGRLPYHALTTQIESLPIPTDFIDITERDLYKLLLTLQANNRNLSTRRIAIDGLLASNNYLGLKEILPPDLFPYIPENAEQHSLILSYDTILDFHLTHWKQGNVDLSITRYSNIADKLTENNIRFVHLYPSHKSIIEKFDKMISDIQISQLVDNQVAIGNITIHNLNKLSDITEESDLQVMLLHKALLEFGSKNHLPLMIQKRQVHFEIITSLKDLKEKVTDQYRNCALFTFLNEQLPFKVNIGWGCGNTIYKARNNAQTANQIAESHPMNCSFVITENDQAIGPLGTEMTIPVSPSTNEQIVKWSERLDISASQIQKTLAVMKQLNSNELSSQDIAFYLGITLRSANRFLNRLEEKGVAKVSYKKQENLRGRPQKIYEIDFSNIDSKEEV